MQFKNIIEKDLIPFMESHVMHVYTHKEETMIDGQYCFSHHREGDQKVDYFVGGKIINAAAYVLCYYQKQEKVHDVARLTPVVKSLIEFSATLPMETWGFLNFFWGLYRLSQHGLLDAVLDKPTKERLVQKLDWRHFVDEKTFKLINKPTNYYGVAFAVAKYRELLLFDETDTSSTLLTCLLDHVKAHSGEFLFMDETEGKGRFDRYSFLIPAEIASHLTETGMKVESTVLKMLDLAAKQALFMRNAEGDGFAYGRSIGTYGDTSVGEILSIAVRLNRLEEADALDSYLYNLAGLHKYMTFWLDKDMKSLNMWEKGRKTDDYRHKGRILGENFSTAMQWVSIYENYEKAGYATQDYTLEEIKKRLKTEPMAHEVIFSKSPRDYRLISYRNGQTVFTLPLINGADKYYDNGAYAPFPQASRLLEPSPNTSIPYYYPHFSIKGKTYIAQGVYENVRVLGESILHVDFHVTRFAQVGNKDESKSINKVLKVHYEFREKEISAQFIFDDNAFSEADTVSMIFPLFGEVINFESKDTDCTFECSGSIKQLDTFGFKYVETNEMLQEETNYQTNHGQYQSTIELQSPLSHTPFGWHIKFK